MKARTDNWCQNNNENINSIYLEWKLDFQHYFPSFLNVYNVTEMQHENKSAKRHIWVNLTTHKKI